MSLNIDIPLVNGKAIIGIQAGIDIPVVGELVCPILKGADREIAATNAAMWAFDQVRGGEDAFDQVFFAAAIYASVKYGLIGESLREKGLYGPDGRWAYAENAYLPGAERLEPDHLSPQFVLRALTLTVSTKINWWSTNHHVGAAGNTGYVNKLFTSYNMDVANAGIRNALHAAGHVAGTIRILAAMGINGLRQTKDIHESGDIRFQLSDDFTLRTTGFPAGAGKAAIAHAILQRMIKHNAMRVCPQPLDYVELAHAYEEITKHRADFHIGSYYLTGKNRTVIYDDLQNRVLGRLGTFVAVFYAATSFARSPSIGPIHGDATGSKFMNYEDYDSEFHKILNDIKRAKLNDEQLQELRASAHILTPAELEDLQFKVSRNWGSERPSVTSGKGPKIGLLPSDVSHIA